MTDPSARRGRLGLLHTSSANRDRFGALLKELAPAGIAGIHSVHEDLLRAALDGVDEAEQMATISVALAAMHAQGAAQILCTCSSIGGLVERVGARLGLPTLRVDRPMAERAVALGRRVLIVACLPSTLGPTTSLLRECATAAGREVEIEVMLLPTAWRLFVDGDEAAYHRAIAAAVPDAPPEVDAVVLAQATMAPAAALLTDFPAPVLSSPRLGLEAALARLAAAPARTGARSNEIIAEGSLA